MICPKDRRVGAWLASAAIAAFVSVETASAQQPATSSSQPPPSTTLPQLQVDTPKKKADQKRATKRAAPQAAAAPTDAGVAPAEDPLGPANGYLATRTMTGTKTDTPLIEVPQSISVVTRDQMDARRVQEDSDVLLYTPGVFAQPFGGALNQYNPHFIIRGFSSAAGGSYVDGLQAPVNFRTEPYGLERTEVLRGPSSVLFGQGDPGGIVNRVRKRPTEEPFREVSLQFGNYNRLTPAFDFGGPLSASSNIFYRLTGLGRFGDAPVDYDFGQKIPQEREYLAPALTWRPSTMTTLTLYGEYLRDDTGQDTSWLRPDTKKLTHLRIDQPGADDFNYEHALAGYAFAHKFDSTFAVRQNLRYTSLNYAYTSMFGGGVDPSTMTIERFTEGFDTASKGLYTDTQIEKKFVTGAAKHTLLAGVDYRVTTDRTAFAFGFGPGLSLIAPSYTQPVPPPDVYQDVTTRSTIVGLYLQDQIKINDQLILTVGGRHDSSRTEATDELFQSGTTVQNDEAMTYRAGLTYLMPGGFAPYISYAESFLPNSGVDWFGTLFDPSLGKQYEAGIKYQPKFMNALFTVAAFDITKQNVLTPDPDPSHPNAVVQTGEIRNRGIEVEATAELASGFKFTSSYTYTEGEITKSNAGDVGNRPQLVPVHMASAWGEYKFAGAPLAGVVVGAGVRYIGANWADNANSLKNEGYVVADFGARYDLGRIGPQLKGAVIGISVNNAFDKEHQACWSAFDCRWITPRTALGTLTYRW